MFNVSPKNFQLGRPIALVGLPGAGKTTVGKSLARAAGLEFLDTDQIIEARIGCSIRTFFEEQGEAAFRKIETSVVDELSGLRNCVISTGGGVVLAEKNRFLLKDQFLCVYLRATAQELCRRLRNDKKRPLLQVADPNKVVDVLYKERDPMYREVAHLTIDTGKPSVGTLTNMICESLLMEKPSPKSSPFL